MRIIFQILQKAKKSLLHSSKMRLGSYVVKKVNQKKDFYQLHYPNNLEDLNRILLPGDVLLVEGEYGMSDWIKVFSSHTWSHCALYVGDQSLAATTKPKAFVEETPNLIEAIIGRGIILSRLNKYQNCNLRICRPKNLSRIKRERVVRFALSKVGRPYDQENIFQFVSLPFNERSRPNDDIGNAKSGNYTCSSLIATAFSQVGFEVLHYYDKEAKKLVPYHNSQIQPKDFDLSPNFDIIKIHPATYRRPIGIFRTLFLRYKTLKHKSA